MDGKSWGLLAVLRDYRSAIEYDFRTRFQCGLAIIGNGMSLSEAARHVERFRADPSSALAAEIEGWEYPVSRSEALLMDLWDIAALHTYKKPKPYPRPWKVRGQTTRHGNAEGLNQAEVKARLAAMAGRPVAPI